MSPPRTALSATALLTRRLTLRSAAVRADGSLFSEVYQEHHQDLYRYIRSILRDPSEAEDVLQSVMLKAMVALREENRDFELRPWLFRIAHNEAINRVRRQRPTTQLDPTHAGKGPPASDVVADRARLSQLWCDLALLPDRQRQALVLRELSGLSHQEIAAVLGCGANVVKQTIFEARTALNELAEGRAMQCAEVQRALSDGDGRVRRGRRLRGHLESCITCRHFDSALTARPQELGALFPVLPAAAGSAMLAHLLHGGGAAVKSGTAVTAGAGSTAGATSTVAAAITTKVAVFAATGIAAAGAAGVAVHHVAATTSPPHGRPASTAPAGHALSSTGFPQQQATASTARAVTNHRPRRSAKTALRAVGTSTAGHTTLGQHTTARPHTAAGAAAGTAPRPAALGHVAAPASAPGRNAPAARPSFARPAPAATSTARPSRPVTPGSHPSTSPVPATRPSPSTPALPSAPAAAPTPPSPTSSTTAPPASTSPAAAPGSSGGGGSTALAAPSAEVGTGAPRATGGR